MNTRLASLEEVFDTRALTWCNYAIVFVEWCHRDFLIMKTGLSVDVLLPSNTAGLGWGKGKLSLNREKREWLVQNIKSESIIIMRNIEITLFSVYLIQFLWCCQSTSKPTGSHHMLLSISKSTLV